MKDRQQRDDDVHNDTIGTVSHGLDDAVARRELELGAGHGDGLDARSHLYGRGDGVSGRSGWGGHDLCGGATGGKPEHSKLRMQNHGGIPGDGAQVGATATGANA